MRQNKAGVSRQDGDRRPPPTGPPVAHDGVAAIGAAGFEPWVRQRQIDEQRLEFGTGPGDTGPAVSLAVLIGIESAGVQVRAQRRVGRVTLGISDPKGGPLVR